MSILIKDMEMPKSCSECGQFRWDIFLQSDVCRIAEAIGYDGIFQSEDEGIYNRPNWCPIIEVPKHGRLIDADTLEEHDGWLRDSMYFAQESSHTHIQFIYANDIINAPTIIPAEEET